LAQKTPRWEGKGTKTVEKKPEKPREHLRKAENSEHKAEERGKDKNGTTRERPKGKEMELR